MFSSESSKVVRVGQFGVEITRVCTFICDHCRSHRAKAAQHVPLQKRVPPAEVCACSLPPLGSTCCVCVRSRARVPTTVLSHPVSSPALAVLFSFLSLLSPAAQETHTGCLCPPRDLPSVRGDQVGGKTLCRNAGPLPEAWLLFQLVTEQKSLFVSRPWSQAAGQPASLSLCRFSRHPRGMGTEAVCLGTLR